MPKIFASVSGFGYLMVAIIVYFV